MDEPEPRSAPARRWNEGPVLACLAALMLGALWTGLAFIPSSPGEDSAAVGFARDMRVHHEQAVQMAEIMRDRTDDSTLRLLATDIALTQQAQIGRMHGWLEMWGVTLSAATPAMAWMGEPTDGLMPGMASRTMVQELQDLPLDVAERRFLSLMIDHHRGGVAMAQGALDHDVPEQVVTLAEAIVMSQNSEIKVMSTILSERGGTPPPPLTVGHHDRGETGAHHGGLEVDGLVTWAFPASATIAVAWLAIDASRRRQAWQGVRERALVSPPFGGLVAFGSGAAGVLHLALTPAHLDASLAAGLVFLVGALAQLGLTGAVWAWPTRTAVVTAGAVSAVLLATYALFRLVPPPGATSPEAVDAIGLVVQALQAAVCIAAFAGLRRPSPTLGEGTRGMGFVHSPEHDDARVGR